MSRRQRVQPPRRSREPTFGEALQTMRQAAYAGVEEAISQAHAYQPPPASRGRPRRRNVEAGERARALFGGVLDAVAEAVVDAAEPGSEIIFAEIVAKMLIAKVHQQSCLGAA